ncbi:YchJ family protein [uncultured Shewanella sp.]|uniref:YchJ family protein n=1 Tax=uncultured Shewanella sp. TaxID=173975 RepID=UPI00262081BD|nr:YchJ family protein [uncultured Shewanella sp.]
MNESASYEHSLLCPCGSKKTYLQCCYLSHQDHSQARSPEQLMRSRYSAYSLKHFNYIIATQHPDFRRHLTVEQLAKEPQSQWLGLAVLSCEQQALKGTVTFKAWYKQDKKIDVIYECSNFILENNLWYYTDGKQMQCTLPKRNESCVCQSGKKFKHCCMP